MALQSGQAFDTQAGRYTYLGNGMWTTPYGQTMTTAQLANDPNARALLPPEAFAESQTPNLSPTAGATDRNQAQMQNLGNSFNAQSGDLIAGTNQQPVRPLGGAGIAQQVPPGLTGSGPLQRAPTSDSYLPADTDLGQTGAFRRGLMNRGIDPSNYLGNQVARSQSPIFESAFNALQALGGTPGGGGEGAYQNFVQGTADPSQAALGAWRQALARMNAGDLTGQAQALINPQTDAELEATVGLGTSALRGQVGPTGLNPFFRSVGSRAVTNYATNPNVAQGGFLNYLKNYLGVS